MEIIREFEIWDKGHQILHSEIESELAIENSLLPLPFETWKLCKYTKVYVTSKYISKYHGNTGHEASSLGIQNEKDLRIGIVASCQKLGID